MNREAVVQNKVQSAWYKTHLFSGIVFILFFCLSIQEIHNYDLFWHLEAGKWITGHGAIPRTDPFSFTRYGQPWIDHSWLSQVILYGTYHLGGWSGLILLKAFLIGICFFLLNRILAQGVKNRFFRLLLLIGIWVLIENRLTVRPEVLSAALFCDLLYLLRHRLEKQGWHLLGVPVLMLVWFNLHAAALAGLGYFGLWLFGEFIHLVKEKDFESSKPLLKRGMFIGLVTVVASMITANGPLTLWYGLSSRSSGIRMIQEWLPPEWSVQFLPFWLSVLLGLGVIAVSWKRQRLSLVLPALVFLLLSLKARRQVLFWGISLCPLIAVAGNGLESRMKSFCFWKSIAALSLCTSFLLLWGWYSLRPVSYGFGLEVKRYPDHCCQYLKEVMKSVQPKDEPLRVMNTHHFGGFLIHALSSRALVFIDGRTRLYGEEGMLLHARLMNDADELKAYLIQQGIDVAILAFPTQSFDCPALSGMIRDTEWPLLFFDDAGAIFVSRNFYRKIQDSGIKNRIDLEELNPLNYADIGNTDPTLIKQALDNYHQAGWGGFRSHHCAGTLLALLHRDAEAVKEFHLALNYEPKAAEAWFNLGNALRRLSQWQEAVRAYLQCLRNRKQWPEALNNLGLAYLDGRQNKKAVQTFERLENVAPGQPQYGYNHALAMLASGERIQGLEKLKRLAMDEPPFAEAAWKLGQLAGVDGDWPEAVQWLEVAHRTDPGSLRNVVDYSGALLEAREFDRAENMLQEVLPRHENHTLLLYNLACAQAQLGKTDQARETLKQCFSRGGEELRKLATTDPHLAVLQNEIRKLGKIPSAKSP